jgi:hypothetical protein
VKKPRVISRFSGEGSSPTSFANGDKPHSISSTGVLIETCFAYLVLAFIALWWVLFGNWIERFGIGHVRQYQDAAGKWHYGRDPNKPTLLTRAKRWIKP